MSAAELEEERSSKRQRTETNADASIDFVRDKDFYLDDGNIILVAEDTAFKTHKSVLSRHSVVFHDMFLLANGSSESHENCEILRLSDSKQDIVCLLQALYDAIVPHELNKLSCLLRISHKYLFHRFLKRTLRNIEKVIPITYEDYKAARYMEYGPKRLKVAVTIITTGVDIFLPVLYYRFSTFIDPTKLEILPASSIAKILTGIKPTLDFLPEVSQTIKARQSASDTCRFGACKHAWKEFSSKFEQLAAMPDWLSRPLDLMIDIMDTHESRDECSSCRTARTDLLDAEAERFWDQLPNIYNVAGSWDELREKYKKLKEPDDESSNQSQLSEILPV